jgi:hypothetical protein
LQIQPIEQRFGLTICEIDMTIRGNSHYGVVKCRNSLFANLLGPNKFLENDLFYTHMKVIVKKVDESQFRRALLYKLGFEK